jgi:deazaflavin-dependent oxidoreductase (nitroreductase family)
MESNAITQLKRLAGKSTLILTHYGRKSGKPYEVKIWFVVDGDKVFIGTANVEHQWIKNVQKNPRIKLSVGGEKFEGGGAVPCRSRRAQPCARCGGTEVLDVLARFRPWENAHSHRPHAKQNRGVRGDIGRIGLQSWAMPERLQAVEELGAGRQESPCLNDCVFVGEERERYAARLPDTYRSSRSDSALVQSSSTSRFGMPP